MILRSRLRVCGAGQQRGATRLTIEEIIRDRAAFASAVAEEAESSLTGQGLVLDTFQLQDIQAEGSYLADLGRPEAARVLEEASIAEARARQAAQQEQLLADEAIAVAQRQLALRQAEITAETDAAAARAAAAGPLAQAAQDQAILTEQEKVAVRTAALTERQLDTQVRRPADAQRYKVEQEAEARKNAAILTAEAEAVEGAKRGEAEKLRRQAIADAVEREGSAEAAAILARGQAEAEALDARSEAFAKYGEAAVLEMLVKVLPEVVQAAAAPLAGVDKMTVISADGAGSLGRSVAANVAQGLQLSGASPAWTSRRCCASSVVRRPPPTASRRSRSPRTGKSQPGRGGPITGAGGSPIGTRAAAQRQSGTARGRGVVR